MGDSTNIQRPVPPPIRTEMHPSREPLTQPWQKWFSDQYNWMQTIKNDSSGFGPKGETGVQGLQGPQGIQGPSGAQGAQGIQGHTGPQGETGIAGETGVQGETGIAGETGVQGGTGVQGPGGVSGSTNQIAKFTGSTTLQDSVIYSAGTTGIYAGPGLEVTSQGAVRVLNTDGYNDGTPDAILELNYNSLYKTGTIVARNSAQVNHGVTDILPTDVPWTIRCTGINSEAGNGGMGFVSVSSSIYWPGLKFNALMPNNHNGTTATVEFIASGFVGTGTTAVNDTDRAFSFINRLDNVVDIMGSGQVRISTLNSSVPPLHMTTVSAYANNGDATNAGLVIGDVYRIGDTLAIVH